MIRIKTGKYKHEIKSTGQNSSYFDRKCDYCKKHCTEIFTLTTQAEYTISPCETFPNGYNGWTYDGCRNFMGHKECFEKMNKKEGEENENI